MFFEWQEERKENKCPPKSEKVLDADKEALNALADHQERRTLKDTCNACAWWWTLLAKVAFRVVSKADKLQYDGRASIACFAGRCRKDELSEVKGNERKMKGSWGSCPLPSV